MPVEDRLRQKKNSFKFDSQESELAAMAMQVHPFQALMVETKADNCYENSGRYVAGEEEGDIVLNCLC